MSELVPSFRDSLFDPRVTDSVLDLVEFGVDAVLVDGVLKELPIVKTLVGIGKFVYAVRERNFLKRTLEFIEQLNKGNLSEEQKERYLCGLKRNRKKASSELDRVMIILDKTIDKSKAQILANFFIAYVKGAVIWSKFCELSEALDRLFVSDIEMLNRIAKLEHKMLFEEGGYSADRLVSVGLVENPAMIIQINFGSTPPFGKYQVSLTNFGRTFLQHAGTDNLIFD